MTECPNPSAAMRHHGAGWRYGCDCPTCTERRAAWLNRRATRAPNAPDCPNPTRSMFRHGATWSIHCGCPSCIAGRSAHARKVRTALASRQEADPVAVDRAVTGDRPAQLNKAERLAATERLDRMGLTARQIATRLRVDPRTVTRYRRENAR